MLAAGVAALAALTAAGCGGGGGKTLTKQEYQAGLNKICDRANRSLGALQITNSMRSFKDHGPQVLDIVQNTVAKFKALKPPKELKDAANRFNDANDNTLRDIEDAVKAAQAGDQTKFNQAGQRAQNDGRESNAAARAVGATHCT